MKVIYFHGAWFRLNSDGFGAHFWCQYLDNKRRRGFDNQLALYKDTLIRFAIYKDGKASLEIGYTEWRVWPLTISSSPSPSKWTSTKDLKTHEKPQGGGVFFWARLSWNMWKKTPPPWGFSRKTPVVLHEGAFRGHDRTCAFNRLIAF